MIKYIISPWVEALAIVLNFVNAYLFFFMMPMEELKGIGHLLGIVSFIIAIHLTLQKLKIFNR